MPPADSATSEYGYVGELARSVPELRKLLNEATSGKWSVEEFTRNLQDSAWWKKNSDRIKQQQILKVTKPGEYQAQVAEARQKIQLAANKVGVGLGPGRLANMLKSYLALGWDDAELNRQLARQINPNGAGARAGLTYGGTAGSVQQQVRKMFADYGVRYSNQSSVEWTRRILTGGSTMEQLQANLMRNAKSAYAAYAMDIDQGMTVKELADPYITMMKSTLELGDGDVDVYDRRIQQALSGRDVKTGAPVAKPLWQFEQDLKDDPRWDKTKGAVNAAYDSAMRIGRDWGFVA